MTPLRLLPFALFLAACGGVGAPSTPPVELAKASPSGDGQTGVVATLLPLPLVVRLTQDGAPVEGRPVTFVAGGGAGSVTPSSATTDSDGLATTSWTLGNSSGARTVTVTSPGASGAPLLFGATALPGPPNAMLAASGQGQLQETGLPFGLVLAIRVQDALGNGISGVTIGWEVTGGSGSVSAPTSLTGTDGRATVSVTAGGATGDLRVTATAAVLPASPVEFGLTVVPAATVITVNSNFFQPVDVTIPAGGSVRWVWNSGLHDVAPTGGPATFPASPVQGPPASFGPLVLDVVGTYTYVCNLHSGMTGTITVQ